MVRHAIAIAAVAAPLLVPVTAKADEPITLRVAVPGSTPTSATYTMVFQPWMQRVEAAAEGTVKLQPFFTIANFNNVYDRVVDGAADIGYGVEGSIGGKFPSSSVVELPSEISGGGAAAGAFWTLFQDGLVASEYVNVHLIALFVFPQNVLNSAKPIARLADIKGLRIATLNDGGAKIVERLGAGPISSSPPELYGLVEHHTADAAIIGWAGVTNFKIAEVTSYHVLLGLDSGGGLLMMNKGAYEKLPAAAKRAIDGNSGIDASQALGVSFDQVYAMSENAVRQIPGHQMVALPPADKERYFREVAEPLTKAWVQRTPNGQAILAAYRDAAAKLQQAK